MVTPATITPGTSATRSGMAPSTAVRVACPMPSTTVFGRLTSMLRAMSYTPGVSSRCLPLRELAVDPLAPSRRRLGDEEVAERDGPARGHAVGPGDAAGVALGRGHPDLVRALRVDEQVRLLPAERGGRPAWCTAGPGTSRRPGRPRRPRRPGSTPRWTSRRPGCCGSATAAASRWSPAGSLESAMNPPLAYCGPAVQ